MSTSNRQHTAESGSRTLTIPQTREVSDVSSPNEPEAGPSRSPTAGVLKLRGGPARRQKVVWSEETVDNEGMGKKKSNSMWHSVHRLITQSVAYIIARRPTTSRLRNQNRTQIITTMSKESHTRSGQTHRRAPNRMEEAVMVELGM
jgi:hypothetical protein